MARSDMEGIEFDRLVNRDPELDANLRARFAVRFVEMARFSREVKQASSDVWLSIETLATGSGRSELIRLTSHYTGGSVDYDRSHYAGDSFIEDFAEECAEQVLAERRRDGSTDWDNPPTEGENERSAKPYTWPDGSSMDPPVTYEPGL